MSTKKIYIEQVDGTLYYRDSEDHQGKTITTEVEGGDKIIWSFYKYSGITEIIDIKPSNPEFFKTAPKKKVNSKKWKAVVAKNPTGETTYTIEYNSAGVIKEAELKSAKTAQAKSHGEPPSLKIKG